MGEYGSRGRAEHLGEGLVVNTWPLFVAFQLLSILSCTDSLKLDQSGLLLLGLWLCFLTPSKLIEVPTNLHLLISGKTMGAFSTK